MKDFCKVATTEDLFFYIQFCAGGLYAAMKLKGSLPSEEKNSMLKLQKSLFKESKSELYLRGCSDELTECLTECKALIEKHYGAILNKAEDFIEFLNNLEDDVD